MGSFGKYSFFVVSLLRHWVGSDEATKRRSDEGNEKSDGGTDKKVRVAREH